jgi:hypothetical protein
MLGVPPKSSGAATNRCVMSRLTKSVAPGLFRPALGQACRARSAGLTSASLGPARRGARCILLARKSDTRWLMMFGLASRIDRSWMAASSELPELLPQKLGTATLREEYPKRVSRSGSAAAFQMRLIELEIERKLQEI